MSEKVFNAKYLTGKIPRKAKGQGKTFVCRRGCSTRTSTYTEEFKWEDVYDGTEDGLTKLYERLENDTTATRKKRPEKRKIADDEFTGGEADSDLEQETPRKKQKFSSVASTPRKIRTPSKLLTPSHKRYVKLSKQTFLFSNIIQGHRQEAFRIHTSRNPCIRR
jgi:origin recognition complex subunit 1